MRSRSTAAAAALFAAMFAAQAAVIATAPVLDEVAADLGVGTATAGQLRTLSGLVAALVGFQVARVAGRVGLRAVLVAGTTLVAVASVASAAAPSFVLLAAAQALLGVAVASIVAAGTVAAGAWAGDHDRTGTLAWALIGQPAAWIVGMPLAGALGGQSWRLACVALPVPAAALATLLLLALRRRPGEAHRTAATRLRPVLADRGIARWALAELLFSCGWSGTLVYAGALFADSYNSPKPAIGLILGGGASFFVCGNLAGRRLAEHEPHRQLVVLAGLLAALVTAFGAVRPDAWTSATLFAVTAFAGGCRTLVGNAVGLAAAAETRLAAMGLRTAAVQVGGVVGTGAAGIALAAGGYRALGLAMAALFAAAAAALVELRVAVMRPTALSDA